MRRRRTEIFSVFGQINAAVADSLIAEGKATRIAPEDIPPSVRYNDAGELAHCALVTSEEVELEFDRRVRALRA